MTTEGRSTRSSSDSAKKKRKREVDAVEPAPPTLTELKAKIEEVAEEVSTSGEEKKDGF